MSNSALPLAGLAVALATLTPAAPAAAHKEVPPTPQITVVGHGEVTARPDMAVVEIGVHTQAPDARQALDENNRRMSRLVEALKAAGIADRDLQTSGFTIWPRYDKDGAQVVGYEVRNTLGVRIRELDQAGELLDRVVAVGANQVSGIRFEVAEAELREREASARAVADARARAEALAKAADVRVGRVLAITQVPAARPVPHMMAMRAEALGAAPSVPVEPGEATFTAEVEVTFALE